MSPLKKLKSLLIVLLLGLTSVIVVGAILLTLLLPTLLQRFGCTPYGIRCIVGQASIRLHPNLTTDLSISHLTLFDPDGRGVALQIKRLAATLNIRTLILARQVMPTEIRLERPELLLRQLDDGRWNLLAMASEVQRHLRPAARPTALQLPRISVTSGALQIGAHRVTDLNATFEPRPAPLLFEMQAQAAVDGRSVQVTGALGDTLDGHISAQIQQPVLKSTLRFHLDQSGHAVTIPEWLFESEGSSARGTATINYGNRSPAYTLTLAEWRADIGVLARQLSFSGFSALTGVMEGKPTTLQGHWPELPVGVVTATFRRGGLELPGRHFGISELVGDLNLHHVGSRLRLQAALHGKTAMLLGQQYRNPSLYALIGIDTATGDVTAEALHASIAGITVEAKGSGRQWGRESLDLTTTELRIDPAFLTQLSQRVGRGVLLTTLAHPSIHLWWPGDSRPWKAEIMTPSIQLHTPTMEAAAILETTELALQGIGISGRELEGTLAIRQADLAGRQLRRLRARFELDPEHIRIPEFHCTVADGDVHGSASFSRTAPLQETRVTVSVHGLRPQSLFASTEKPAGLLRIPFDAELSAVLSHGLATVTIDLPPAATEQLRHLVFEAPPTTSASQAGRHLLLQAQGIFRTDQGVQASGSVRVHGLRELLAGGDSRTPAFPLEIATAYRDGLLTLKAQKLALSAAELSPLLSRLVGRRIVSREGHLVVSADATFGGSQPPTVGGSITFHGLSVSLARQATELVPLLTGVQGAVAFTFDKGVLTIKKTTLRTDGELTLVLAGSLPLGHNNRSGTGLHLTVPWTEIAVLRSPLSALAGGQLDATRFTGQLQANLELIGSEYHGALSLRNVSIGSNSFQLENASGVIPLHGRIDQGSTVPLHQVVVEQSGGWSNLTEHEYRSVLERLSTVPAKAPFSLTIRTLHYDPIELRNIEIVLASSENRIAVQRLAFDALGGRWHGRGTVEPFGGGIAVDLLTEGLSLRAICDAFPPIKGYISGQINGMATLIVPGFTLDQAQGGARFWAVDAPREKRKISRTLIEQLAGQQIRYFSLFGVARRYDRGVMGVTLKAGNLSFHELEISHTIIGHKDLDVRVSPTFNRIGLTHLIDSITEAIERIRASTKSNH